MKVAGTGFLLSAIGAQGVGAAADDVEAAERAKRAVADDEGADPSSLTVVSEHVATYDDLGEEYYDAKVRDPSDGSVRVVRLDERGDRVDPDEVRRRAREAHRQEHGNLTRDLSGRVESAAEDEEIPITVWTESVDRSAARQAAGVAGEPPTAAAREALSNEVVSRITKRTESLASDLSKKRGVTVEHAETASPSVIATATPKGVERVERHPDVVVVFERATEYVPELQEAAQTHGSWDGSTGGPEYDASGLQIGIYDRYNPESESHVNLEKYRDPDYGTTTHAHEVSMAAASTTDPLPGMAANAELYAAAASKDEHDSAMQWFDFYGCSVVNASWGTCPPTDPEINELDLRFDKYALNRDITVTKSAGNGGGYWCGDAYGVTQPGRGFNTLTVGNVDEQETGTYKIDDERDNNSCYVDPNSEHGEEITKPEVAAVGEEVDFPTGNTDSGTSYAAPQVAGLVALLEEFAADASEAGVVTSPEVSKAIVAASTSNAGDYSEKYLGTGTIRAPLAEQIVTNDQYWTAKMGQTEAGQSFTIPSGEIAENDTVTVALAWLSDPSQRPWSSLAEARSEIDLDLRVTSPDDATGLITDSRNPDRGFEWARFQVPGPSDVTLEVENVDWESADSEREFALAWSKTTDAAEPETVSNLRVTDHDSHSVDLAWDEAFDEGGSGVQGYRSYVDGWPDDGTPNDNTSKYLNHLAPGESYELGVTAVDEAGNESGLVFLEQTTDSVGSLVLHDFDGDPAWPGNNELGNWADADGFVNDDGEVDREALVLEYDDAGWFKSDVGQDVSDYQYLKIRARGPDFPGDDCSLSFGGVEDTLGDLAQGFIYGLEFSVTTIDMVDAGMDRTAPGSLELNFWDGSSESGWIAIDHVWFE